MIARATLVLMHSHPHKNCMDLAASPSAHALTLKHCRLFLRARVKHTGPCIPSEEVLDAMAL